MSRFFTILIAVTAAVLLFACCILPLAGMSISLAKPGRIDVSAVAVPGDRVLLFQSLTMAFAAAGSAIILGWAPAFVLSTAGRRSRIWLTGLVMMPLLVPPQVYAYAWQLLSAPSSPFSGLLPANLGGKWAGGAVRAGLISGAWLWPLVALIVAGGWRRAGHGSYLLALLDTTPARAYVRVVLPALQPHLIASGSLVAGITLIEYAIAHLTLCRTYATELLILTDVGAPPGQVIAMALRVLAIVAVFGVLAGWFVRTTRELLPTADSFDAPAGLPRSAFAYRRQWIIMLAAGLSWLVAAGMPVLILLMNLRDVRIGLRGLWLFQQDFLTSAAISAIVAGLTLLVAIGTVLLGKSSQKQGLTWLGGLFCLTAAIPAAALGIGFIVIFNRSGFVGDLYAKTATVWVLALVARFAVIPVVVTWLTVRRDPDEMIGQARLDGAGVSEILVNIMLLRAWPTLLASGLIVMLLSMFEVVITQLVRPAGFRSIAASLLNQMHYGRDDVVILISLAIVGVGVMMALACSWLLVPRGHRDT